MQMRGFCNTISIVAELGQLDKSFRKKRNQDVQIPADQQIVSTINASLNNNVKENSGFVSVFVLYSLQRTAITSVFSYLGQIS